MSLVKSIRVHNLTNGVGCTLLYSRRGKRKRGEEERGRSEFSRWITLWFAPDRIPRTIWRSQQGGGYGSSAVGEGEYGLVVLRNDNHPLANRVLIVGGAYEALEIDAKRAINMGTRLALKIHERGEGSI